MPSIYSDFQQGVELSLPHLQKHIIDKYIFIPIGLLITLGTLYGVNEIILLTKINFPASVTCMLILYLILVLFAKLFGEKRLQPILNVINIPFGWSLRWINIFFTPAFITLPLSPWISAREALTIAAIFVFGYFICTAFIAYFCIGLQKLMNVSKRSLVERADELETSVDYDLGKSTAVSDEVGGESRHNSIDSLNPAAGSGETDLQRLTSYQSGNPSLVIEDLARGDEDSIEEMYRRDQQQHQQTSLSRNQSTNIITVPSPIKLTSDHTNDELQLEVKGFKKLFCVRTSISQNQPPLERHVIYQNFLIDHFDHMILGLLFVVGLPLYYVPSIQYEMPLQLAVAIATFLFILNLPFQQHIKRFFHPVLCSVGLSLLCYYIFAVIKHESFLDTIRNYKTGRNYLKLFNNHSHTALRPGAGDVFSSLMDISIVSLSIPMYTYRRDLKRHILVLLPTILLMTGSNFFVYPPLCHALGLSSQLSLGFSGRSVTLALGTPFVEALQGSVPLMACTTVVSGIIGALTCELVFGSKVLRINEDDYITRGATLGLNCGAIATAHLLTVDPRAAAISSLSFVLFGTFMVVMGSIVPLGDVVRGWAGV
ncbi:hypothetical protein WICPIJ_001377 [Wickerhamomyces pijperi]|uniref:LrgB-like protein n=1 Tax=Wickerhamomyces pijperi TaxID=599730 RepID=A0A9P8QB17_WICPI|nr:hypothetical protein WICPIJ_001377 [Wickerhamomyces pijperi]